MSEATATAPGRSSLGRSVLGLSLVVLSSAAFGTSGAFAKSLLASGWSPGGVVTWRVVGAAILMLPLAVLSMRGQWHLLRRNAGSVILFGLVAVAGCQFAYFNAVESLSVAVALLLEYLGVVLVVGWMWLRHHRRPHRLTVTGVIVSIIGLLFVLEVFSGVRLSVAGLAWGLLAAAGLATYYVTASSDHDEGLPPLALAGFGIGVGAIALAALSASGLITYTTQRTDVAISGATFAWWVPVAELAIVAAALAYGVGVLGTRMAGATVSSFVGLSEVLFAVLVAWLVLGELPGPAQAGGGALILLGVVAVRLGESRSLPPIPSSEATETSTMDFAASTPVT